MKNFESGNNNYEAGKEISETTAQKFGEKLNHIFGFKARQEAAVAQLTTETPSTETTTPTAETSTYPSETTTPTAETTTYPSEQYTTPAETTTPTTETTTYPSEQYTDPIETTSNPSVSPDVLTTTTGVTEVQPDQASTDNPVTIETVES